MEAGNYTTGQGFSFTNILNKSGEVLENWAVDTIKRQFEKDNNGTPVYNSPPESPGAWKRYAFVGVAVALGVWLLAKALR